MVLKKFQIVFDNPWSTYYSGQPVTGRLLISVDSPKKIRGLVIHFKGEANVKWDETKNKNNSEGNSVNETTVYSAQEQYFENKFNLMGGSGNEVYIQPGEQSYPFSTYLPPNLPSSFEGEFGYVRYTVKAILDRPWKFDQDVKAAFTVISPLDLNLHETAKNPVKIEREKFFCCCCCKSGPLALVLSLPVGGYVPGQAIPVTVEADNCSNVNITAVKCTLRKVVIFRATSPTTTVRKDKVTIAEHSFGAVEATKSNTWTEQLIIPPLPPSNLQNCNIIDLEYDLKLEAKVSGLHQNIEIKTAIVLGTIPLVSYQPLVPILKPAEMNGGETNGTKVPSGPPIPPGVEGWTPAPQGGPGMPSGGQPQWGPNVPPAVQPQGDPNVPPQWGPNVPPAVQPQGDPNVPPQWGPNVPPAVQPQGDPNAPPQWGPSVQPQVNPNVPPQWGPNGPPQGNPNAGPPQWGPPTGYPQAPSQWGPNAPQGSPNAPSPVPASENTLYPTIPAPSFAESTFGSKNIQDSSDNQYTQGDMQFTPRYPVYNFQPQQ